jgi:RNA polymerase-binding transcription factor DksA
MNRTELEKYRMKLVALVRRLTGESANLRHEAFGAEAGVSPADVPIGQADLGVAENEEETALSVLGTEEELLAECNAALERIERGSFGTCEACGKTISRGRLDSIPYTRNCRACARASESGGMG